MKSVLLVALLVLGCETYAAPQPLPVRNVNALKAGAAPSDGHTRLRLSLSSNSLGGEKSARLGGLSVCSEAECYESAVPSTVALTNTSKGTSVLVADWEIPFATVRSVRFKQLTVPSAITGSIDLPEPLKLEKNFRGGEILIVVSADKSAATELSYQPTAAASNLLREVGTSVFYNPNFNTITQLPFDAIISIPAGAYSSPLILNFALHDTGEEFPLVDIYPVLKLTKAATVQLNRLLRPPQPLMSTQSPRTPVPQAAPPGGGIGSQPPSNAQDPKPVKFEIRETGVIRGARPAGRGESAVPRIESAVTAYVEANPAGWTNCANALIYPVNQQIISNGLTPTGTVFINWCETIAPYVHIAISALSDPRERYTIKHDPKVLVSNVYRLPLQRITTWAQYTQVMINSFTWVGDEGVFSGGYGRAKGYLNTTYDCCGLGENLVTGGSCEDFFYASDSGYCVFNTPSDGNKRVFWAPEVGTGFVYLDATLTGWPPVGIGNYVSSSTSIVRNGVCTTDSFLSRWSAVGTTSGGRIVFISSLSEKQTTAAQLCPVFQALGVSNAIRLDGGFSAALTVDGNLRNPLTGMFSFPFGFARYIPYALKVSYPGW